MMWIIYSLLVALFNSARSVASKKSLRSIDKYVVSWILHFLSFLFLLPFFLFVDFPRIGGEFWPVFVLDCALSAVATVFSVKALLKSDISLVMPISAFTPLFMLFTGLVMIGEFPTLGGVVGVLLIVAGTYCLNISERKNGWIAPFKGLLKQEGPKLMLGAALIWSVTGNLDKIAIQYSSPVFFSMAENLLIGMFILPFAYTKIKKQKREIAKDRNCLLAIGLFAALATVFQMIAITQTLVVYVVSIKRLTILISIVMGGIIFKEENIRERLVGGAIMVLGVLFITL